MCYVFGRIMKTAHFVFSPQEVFPEVFNLSSEREQRFYRLVTGLIDGKNIADLSKEMGLSEYATRQNIFRALNLAASRCYWNNLKRMRKTLSADISAVPLNFQQP
ncbi:MAG: hypothetical protein A3G52_01140 [Candidatus Taylorbacteria bacterium RIFCSPLOWO2_12_FULL_43_20]|uniref:Uncharacterized protein n=1 Tax=Candidatus Taylorbacteria bacterium RIFCSPLOWO2_12_FULL_43_20 TaxID=1802332 RepID=A0A1G2P462_9BACT|nr:MAG: hypothetical protein A3E92_03260 [Candidatus Taylorbacteria bacterium RIFCSPHIGHO2_12_FULL_42_34]OHA39071.1 MAG: hypothetical protein A3H58_01830 [Candidatus Taylorbacteria bacterium RIFCSPLOWO2_02_FULL_43_22b]OHA42422.1 MAG: hypothetical protein A3G52_01140 [Candidatus Taylorbacteria bacterium RIFCSPLOWO2_12_FULL_43_20]